MNKLTFALVIVATLVVALLATGPVSAQGAGPANPQTPGYANGNGSPMGGRGVRGAVAGSVAVGDGILHDALISVYAKELGISVDELNARLEGGESLSQIAFEKGLTVEKFRTLMIDARSQAVEKAVIDGTLTQEQADWMNQRSGIARGRAARGGGFAGTEGCPYYPQTTP